MPEVGTPVSVRLPYRNGAGEKEYRSFDGQITGRRGHSLLVRLEADEDTVVITRPDRVSTRGERDGQ